MKRPHDTKMFHYWNANPQGKNIDDCFIRCVCGATGIKYETVERALLENLINRGYRYSYGNALNFLNKNFTRVHIPDTISVTLKKFCEMRKYGTFICQIDSHLTCIKNSVLIDTDDYTLSEPEEQEIYRMWIVPNDCHGLTFETRNIVKSPEFKKIGFARCK